MSKSDFNILYHLDQVLKTDPHFQKLFDEVEKMIQEGKSKAEILDHK